MKAVAQSLAVQVTNAKQHSHNKTMIKLLSSFIGSTLDNSIVGTITLGFAQCEKRSCGSVSIVDDVIVEDVESYGITLEKTPDLGVTLDPADGVVKITHNDGRYDNSMLVLVIFYDCSFLGPLHAFIVNYTKDFRLVQ